MPCAIASQKNIFGRIGSLRVCFLFDHCRVKAAHGQVGILISASNFRMFRRIINRLVSIGFSLRQLAPLSAESRPKPSLHTCHLCTTVKSMPRTARYSAFRLLSPSYLSCAQTPGGLGGPQ